MRSAPPRHEVPQARRPHHERLGGRGRRSPLGGVLARVRGPRGNPRARAKQPPLVARRGELPGGIRRASRGKTRQDHQRPLRRASRGGCLRPLVRHVVAPIDPLGARRRGRRSDRCGRGRRSVRRSLGRRSSRRSLGIARPKRDGVTMGSHIQFNVGPAQFPIPLHRIYFALGWLLVDTYYYCCGRRALLRKKSKSFASSKF